MKCANCGHENDQDAEYCEQCGSALKRTCLQCGSPLKQGAGFCKKCGAPVPAQDLSAEKEKRLRALQRTAPSDLRDKILTSSAKGEGERKPVTILFTDIVGSTSLAERLDPEEWREIVSGAHQRVSQAVYKYEGTIAQLLGDGVLAFFGAPITHEDDPVRAVRAALDIQQAIGRYADELKGYVDGFQMRIGLNSGMVVVGSVGSDLHMEYLAIGDAVNLAARLQSAAQPGRVLISESTARNVRATFELQDMGALSLKGKAEPVTAFEVIKAKAVTGSGRGFEELSSPLVGRDRELALLREKLAALALGNGQILTVIGEAGIGKSRLAEEARREGVNQQMHWIEGRALSYGQTLSFWSISQLLYNDLGLSDGAPEVKVHTALKRRLNALFGEKDIEILPYLAQLLGVRLEGEPAERVRQLDGETLKRQTVVCIGRYFERLAEKQPTVAVFEDLHWADSSSLEALEALLAVTDRAPLMLVLLSRLEREHGSWRIKVRAESDFAHRYTEIVLKPLSPNEQNELVDNLLAIADLPAPVRQLIVERADGNPFYLEEIVRSLIDQQAIVRDGDQWRATGDLVSISIPETLEGVLLARIDRLQDDVRRTLQMAAVIGKSFLYKILESIAAAEEQLQQHLAQLQRVDLVREKARLPELEYMFKHSLTQEAAYNSLLLERRRQFHRQVGEALEQLFADRKEQYLGLLAHHFEAAGEHSKAIAYLTQAGDRARLTDEHSEAIGYYLRALGVLEAGQDETRAAQVWLKLGLIYHANFQFEEAHTANEKAFALQQKAKPEEQPAHQLPARLLRVGHSSRQITQDPGLAFWQQDFVVLSHLFAGLAQINDELDVVPAVARSWQVLDEGKRYLFHLRDDVIWTDGAPVTAANFEWAWKRNLDPTLHSETANLLHDIAGAREFHEGRNQDPNSVGVRALDTHTLEVRLADAAPNFPFIVTLPVAYPLPRKVVEAFGETWWHPAHIVSNGPYQLIEFDADRALIARNHGYFGAFPGNAERVEVRVFVDPKDKFNAYLEDRIDHAFFVRGEAPERIPPEDIVECPSLGVFFLLLPVKSPPFDDVRVRKAFSLSLDRREFYEKFDQPFARGGLVPPGMPGHSPDIGLSTDVDLARRLMKEAGFPGGKGFPAIRGLAPGGQERSEELCRQWRESLGVDIQFETVDPVALSDPERHLGTPTPTMNGWVADYPDPDNFLRDSEVIFWLHRQGWQDAEYDQLVEQAGRTRDRAKRMALYRQADRMLVQEQVAVVPILYHTDTELVKPWAKKERNNLLGYVRFHEFIIEDH